MAKPLFDHRRKLPSATAGGGNGLSFSGKDAYDDVFSGGLKPKLGAAASAAAAPPSFSSRRVASDDYAEIFGGKNGARGSSIPVLDLSDLDDRNESGDFRSSGGGKVDYSMIFGGGGDVPAAVPAYEELLAGVKKAKRDKAKARIPARAGSPLKGSDRFNASDNINSHTCEASDQILGSGKQFNMSYHKTGEQRKDVLNRTTHVAQLNAVPGFTYVIDETARMQKKQLDKAMPAVQSEVYHNRSSCDFLQKTDQDKAIPPVKVEINSRSSGDDRSDGKFGTRSKWQLPTKNASEGLVPHKVEFNCETDCSRDKLLNANNVGLKSNFLKEPSPSSSSGNLKDRKGHPQVSMFSSFSPKVESSEVTSGYATPLSDEKLDVNSAAAASIEALTKAIEQAQESIRLAKEKMERKSRSRDSLKANGERDINYAQEANNTSENNFKDTCKSPESEAQDSIEFDQEIGMGSGGVVSGFTQKERPTTGRQAVAEMKCENVEVVEDNGVATWFTKMLNNGKQKMASLASELIVKKNSILQPMDKDTDNVEETKPAKATLEWDTTGKVNNADGGLQFGNAGAKLNVLGRSEELEKNVDDPDSSRRESEDKPTETLVFAQKDEATMNRGLDLDKEENDVMNPKEYHETSSDIQFKLHKLGNVLPENKLLRVEEKSLEPEAERKLEDFSAGDENDGSMDTAEINEKQEEFYLGVDNEDVSMDVEEDKPKLSTDYVSNEKRLEDDLEECYHRQEHNEKRFTESVEEEEKQILSEDEEVWEGVNRSPAEPQQNEEANNIDDATDNNSLDQEIEVNEELQESKDNPMGNLFREAAFRLSLDANFDVSGTCESTNFVDFQDTCISEVENICEPTGQVENIRNYEETEDLAGFAEESSQQESRENEDVADKFGNTDEYLQELGGDAKAQWPVEEALNATGEHTLETLGVDHINAEEKIMESVMQDISDATAGLAGNTATFGFRSKVHESEQSKDLGVDGFSNNATKQDIRDDEYVVEASAVNNSPYSAEASAVNNSPDSAEASAVNNSPDSAEASAVNNSSDSDLNYLNVHTQLHENDRSFELPHTTEIWDGYGVYGQNHIEESDRESESSMDPKYGYGVFHETQGNAENSNVDGIGCGQKIEKDDIERCQEEIESVRNENESKSSHFAGEEDPETNSDRKTDQSSENDEENVFRTYLKEVKETRETVQKEEAGKDDVETSEVKKKDRERERDRITVERAIREARERAFAEARERAERAAVEKATAEVRRRAMAEAREKLDKVPSGAKPTVDKASIAAKLRAERAAVERATAEARERALEKALSLKNTSETRTQPERDATGKFSGPFRDGGIKHSYSSSDLENFDGTNSESAQRRKARLERHQRIMERAAKALAEKNLRDVLAQREQAQRNRLAETLDAEIKRWASGKEGNLRALLSTLQYILGPSSGWQPISLTEIVTTAAVKKAYRKATLYVHPDKLQQRGASIQQKYICEKVFDLLKAAWNKFNSEER